MSAAHRLPPHLRRAVEAEVNYWWRYYCEQGRAEALAAVAESVGVSYAGQSLETLLRELTAREPAGDEFSDPEDDDECGRFERKGFDPSEARDEHGRWTGSSGAPLLHRIGATGDEPLAANVAADLRRDARRAVDWKTVAAKPTSKAMGAATKYRDAARRRRLSEPVRQGRKTSSLSSSPSSGSPRTSKGLKPSRAEREHQARPTRR